jgi:hypothetical protein
MQNAVTVFLNQAADVMSAATSLGHCLTDAWRGNDAPSVRDKPPEPHWSSLLEALHRVGSSIHTASDPSLHAVKQLLLAIAQRVNQCQQVQPFDSDHPLWRWGPEFYTEALALWEAIKAVPRKEPGFVTWANPEVPAPVIGNDVAVTETASLGNVSDSRPSTAAGQTQQDGQPPTPSDDEFLEFTVKQRKLLLTLQRRGAVSIAEVKKAVYGTIHVEDSRLDRLKSRTNQGLVQRDYGLEIKRRANTYSLLRL